MKTAKSLEDRFWAKVVVVENCWEWVGATNGDGYGRISRNGINAHAHRVSWEMYRGPIPGGMEIDHICRNRNCVNPEHMEIVTHRENTLRGISVFSENSRKTHCLSGHPLVGDNLYVYGNGWRKCRECRRAGLRKLYAKRRGGR